MVINALLVPICVTLCCLTVLPAASEEERSHLLFAKAGALWAGDCGSAAAGESYSMADQREPAILRLEQYTSYCFLTHVLIRIHTTIKGVVWGEKTICSIFPSPWI